MKKNTMKIILVLFLLSINGVFAQEMLQEISLKEQIDNSTLVVEGEVVSKTSFWDNNLIYTANTVQVYKVFKGDPVSTIDVITLGGTVGLEAMMASSSLKLKTGNVGVFLLINSAVTNKSTNKVFKPYSAVQGFYKYNLFDDRAVNPFNQKQGISSGFYKEIMAITQKGYDEISAYNVSEISKGMQVKKSAVAPGITSFSPTTATAGTKTVVTIIGTGFGATKGKVGFYDANEGGGAYIDALDSQVTWSDTQILVEVPSDAGTGKIRVKDALLNSVVSTGILSVPFAEFNVEYNPGTGLKAYPTQFYDQFGGGYQWRMYTDFFNDNEHPGARAAFERAFETWRCTTKVNWTIRSTADVTNMTEKDSKNIIRFDDGSELAAGVLGTCVSYWNARSCNGTFEWYVGELDIVFDDGANWNFGPGATTGGKMDFETVALHELGHGQQLGHVIDTNALMNYNISPNEDVRTISPNDVDGGNDVVDRSVNTSVCDILDPMTLYAGTCSLGLEDEILKNGVNMYPNPSRGIIYITNELNLNLTKASVFDMSGRLISKINLLGTSKTSAINLQGLAKGMYLVTIQSDTAFTTKKLVLE